MTVTLEIADEFAALLTQPGQPPSRTALEAWGLEAYRQRRLSEFQLRTLLGIPSRWELDAFLKQHQVEKYTAEDFEHDWAAILKRRSQQAAEPHA
jgi:Uncharacterised protein family (UPF0175)